MIRLYCRGNVIEYTGDGWLQCSRSVACPKKKNNKILGFDCLLYIDNLPENVKLLSPEMELSKEIKDVKEAKDLKEINEPIKESKEVLKEIQDMSDHIVPIISVPSKAEIDRKNGDGKNKEKQNGDEKLNGDEKQKNVEDEIIDISPIASKMKSAEKVQA